jgi:hypothetical protein
MSEHTPGPWHWHRSRTQQHLHDKNGSCFAQVSMPSPHNVDQAFTAIYAANAALIAAAPDMLWMLKDLINIEGPQPGHVMWAIRVKAVIAKAEGR